MRNALKKNLILIPMIWFILDQFVLKTRPVKGGNEKERISSNSNNHRCFGCLSSLWDVPILILRIDV